MRAAGLACGLLLTVVLAAPAQTPSRHFLTVSLAMTTGGHSWSLQPAYLPVNHSTEFDSVALRRSRHSGFALDIQLTRFVTPALAWTAGVGYVPAPMEALCDSLGAWAYEAEQLNRQACANVTSRQPGGLVGAQAGVLLRPLSRSGVSPYVRGAVGGSLLYGQWVATKARVVSNSCGMAVCELYLLDENRGSPLVWTATLAGGIHARPQGGFAVRFEGRDFLAAVPVPAGPERPPDTNLRVPLAKRVRHFWTVAVGLEIDLERRHSRRY